MLKAVNINDIAKFSGVSIATVSRVLNNGKVNSETKAKILKIMEKHNYVPNAFARGLNLNSSKMVGVIVSDIGDIFLSRAVSIIERELRECGYEMNLHCANEDMATVEDNIQFFKKWKVAGIFFVGSKLKVLENNLHLSEAAKNIPAFFIYSEVVLHTAYSLVADDVGAVRNAVQHLFDKGHRRFLYLYDEETPGSADKHKGFTEGITLCGLPSENMTAVKCEKGIHNAQVAAAQALKGCKITAAIAASDELAVGILRAAEELSITVPEQLAVIGYDNSVLSISSSPKLTSIDNKIESLCEHSVRLFLDVINKKRVPKKITVECEMVIREST